jgi:uncharacterized protein involved in outer membrane biogenesis
MARRRSHPVLIVLLAIVVLVPALGLAWLTLVFDPNSLKPRLVAAVHAATGRDLALRGRLSLVPSLSPSFAANDVALSNRPGGSRPEMVTVGRLEVQVSLLPLLSGRVEVVRLVLEKPDILLETDASGTGNWVFTPSAAPPAAPAPKATAPANAAPTGSPMEFAVRSLRIQDGQLTWHDGRTGTTTVVALRQLDVAAEDFSAPVTFTALASVRGAGLSLSGQTGSFDRLQDLHATSPWPVQVALEVPGARLAATGSLTHPLALQGYTFRLEGSAAILSSLSDLAGRHLPPLRDVAVAAKLDDAGGGLPAVSALTLHAGASDLAALAPGLTLARLDASAPSMDQPVHAELEGSLGGLPLNASFTGGGVGALLQGRDAPMPLDLAASAAGATLAVKGTVARPRAQAGVDLAVTARVPDLRALSPLAGRMLPALHNAALDVRVADQDGLAHGVVLRGLALVTQDGDVSGDATLHSAPRASVQATLASRRLDLDALLADLGPPPAGGAAPAATPPEAPGPPPAPPRTRLFPDTPLPLGALKNQDADVRWTVAELHAGSAAYRDLALHLVLAGGKLVLDPFAAQTPGGKMNGMLSLDANPAAPPLAFALHAPALALKPLLAALHLPAEVTGTMEVDADLHGAGNTPHAIAASLDGRLGVAMVNADVDNRLLGPLLTQVLQAVRQGVTLGSGTTRVRCLATRLDVAKGVATANPLVLDTDPVLLQGGGTINLGEERLALRLRPMLRAGGGIVVPVRVDGTLLAPRATVDSAGAAGAALGALAGRGGVLGALGAGQAERGGDACSPALAAVRAGRPGAAPAPAAPAPATPAPAGRAPGPADLLRGLIR